MYKKTKQVPEGELAPDPRQYRDIIVSHVDPVRAPTLKQLFSKLCSKRAFNGERSQLRVMDNFYKNYNMIQI